MKIMLILSLIAIATVSAAGDELENKVLLSLETALKDTLPGCKTSINENSILIEWNVRTFFVHKQDAAGIWSDTAVETKGPDWNGIKILVRITAGKYKEPFGRRLLTKTSEFSEKDFKHRPYWREVYGYIEAKKQDRYAVIHIDFGQSIRVEKLNELYRKIHEKLAAAME